MSAAEPQKLTRGSIVMTATKVLAVLMLFAMNRYLTYALTPEQYGLLGVVLTVLVWLELAVGEGLPVWVAGNVDSAATWRERVPTRFLLAQLALAVALTIAMALAAPLLAGVFKAPESVQLFRVAALDIPAFAFYNLFLGLLLGARLYGGHAASTGSYAASKLAFTVLFVGGGGLAATGAALGNVAASVVGLAVTLVALFSAPGARGARGARAEGRADTLEATGGEAATSAQTVSADAPPAPAQTAPAAPAPDVGTPAPDTSSALAGSAAPAAFLLLQTLIFSIDLWLVAALLPGPDAAYYRAAALVAQVPVTLLGSFTWAVYAAYSSARRGGDAEKSRHYVSQTTRLLLIGGVMWAAIIAPTAGSLMALLFNPTYRAGGVILAALSLGFVVGNAGVVLAPTLLAERRFRLLLSASAGLLVVEVAAAALLIPRVGAVGAAIACGGALALGGIALLVHLRDQFNFAFWATCARVGIPGAIVGAVAWLVPIASPLWLFAWYPLLAAAFVGLLWLSGGVGREDLAAIRDGME